MIAALEGEHQALAAGIVAHQLQRILDCLRAADIEMNPSLAPELALGVLGDHGRQFHLFAVQVLRGDLRQPVELPMCGVVQAFVAIAEIDGGIPHLQIEKRRAGLIVDVGAFAFLEEFRFCRVVDRIADGSNRSPRRIRNSASILMGNCDLATEGFGYIGFH